MAAKSPSYVEKKKRKFLSNLRKAAGSVRRSDTRHESEEEETPRRSTENKEEEKPSRLDKFCEDGELSGFKFLHSSYPLWFRSIWILFMILFITMMLYQLIVLFIHFAENPVAMDIEQTFPPFIVMPNVLICPHTQLRLTKLYKEKAIDIAAIMNSGKDSVDQLSRMEELKQNVTVLRQMTMEWNRTIHSPDCRVADLREATASYKTYVNMTMNRMEEFPTTLSQLNTYLTTAVNVLYQHENMTGSAKCNATIVPDTHTFGKIEEFVSHTDQSYRSFLKRGISLPNETVIRCSYKDNEKYNCKPDMTVVPTVFGDCILLNMSQQNVSRSGIDNALTLEFDAAVFDAAVPGDTGLTLTFLSEGDIPYSVDPVELNVGYNVHVPIRVSKESFHSSTCRSKKLEKLNLPYSRSGCMLEKFLEKVEEDCGCRPYGEPNTGKQDCSVVKQLTCVAKLVKNATLLWNGDCPVACEQTNYNPTLSYSVTDYTKWEAAPEEWRKYVNESVRSFFELSKNAQELNISSLRSVDANFYMTVYLIFKEMYVHFETLVLPGLMYHGPEFLGYPLNPKYYKANISKIIRLGECRLMDMQIPYPKFMEKNSTLYVASNSIASMAHLEGGHSYNKQVLSDDIYFILQFALNALRDWKNDAGEEAEKDILAKRVLELGEALGACLEENGCNEDDNGKACIDHDTGICGNETNIFALALYGVNLVRDHSFLMNQYLVQIQGQNSEYSTWAEAVAKPFAIEYLDVNNALAKFWSMTPLTAAGHMLKGFYTWRKYWSDQLERTDQLLEFLAYVKETADPTPANRAFELVGISLPPELEAFNRHYNCSLLYAEVWKEAKNSKFLTQDWLENALNVLETAQGYIDMTDAKENYYRKNTMSATIYISELKVEHRIQYSAYDFWNMLSDIGGTISLYVGGTIITFFEIIFVCTELDRKKKLIKRTKKKVNRQTQLIGAVGAFKMGAKPKTPDSNPTSPFGKKSIALDLGDGTPPPANGEPGMNGTANGTANGTPASPTTPTKAFKIGILKAAAAKREALEKESLTGKEEAQGQSTPPSKQNGDVSPATDKLVDPARKAIAKRALLEALKNKNREHKPEEAAETKPAVEVDPETVDTDPSDPEQDRKLSDGLGTPRDAESLVGDILGSMGDNGGFDAEELDEGRKKPHVQWDTHPNATNNDSADMAPQADGYNNPSFTEDGPREGSSPEGDPSPSAALFNKGFNLNAPSS